MVLNTLSGRFLVLTVLFVMIVEVLIFVPSVARFRQDYLQNKLDLAQLAALATLGTPEGAVSQDLEVELLETAGVRSVILRRDGVRELVLAGNMPLEVIDHFDISTARPLELITDAMRVFLSSEDRVIHVSGVTRSGSEGGVEIDVDEQDLRAAMLDYGTRVFQVSLLISLATATLLFFVVRRLMVRPIKRVVNHMLAYRDSPEDTTRIISPSSSTLEFREAESALHDLEVRLTASLRQKERLAALGSAVAKISHDLRNILSTAQILTDGIDASQDPRVRRTAPKLVNSLDRAVALCERTLTFGKAEEPEPVLERVPLAPLVGEVVDNERQSSAGNSISIVSEVPDDLHLYVDPEQLFRVLSNLVRNAVQAIQGTGEGGTVTVTGHRSDGMAFIRVCDTGPGLPPKAREHLFKPFEGGARQGGTGLGLVIAAEIIRGHGGELQLEVSDTDGTIFAITLPAVEAARAAG